MELKAGQRVDRFELTVPLGAGGQGAVWKATDPLEPERPRALKLIPLALARSGDLERARREARALARLEHPSLVACDALFEDLRAGLLGLVMDFVEGASLRKANHDPRFDPRHRALALRHVASALGYLHDSGVVHRDLKLDNVLVAESFWTDPEDPGGVKVVDLGIAAVAETRERLTAVGSVVGTVPYLAPELLDPGSFPGEATDKTVDVFAFGVLGWQVVSGEHPSGLSNASGPYEFAEAYRAALRAGAPFPPRKFPGEWGRVLADALRLTATERIANGTELELRCRSAEPETPTSGTVPVSLRGPETAVASPKAMVDQTAEVAAASAAPEPSSALPPAPEPSSAVAAVTAAAPPEAPKTAPPPEAPPTQASAPRVEPSTPAPRTEATEGGGGVGKGLLLAGLVIAAGAGVYFLSQSPKPSVRELPAPLPSASTVAPSLIEPEDAGLDGDAGDAGDGGANASLPVGCATLCDCCPSGRSCAPGTCSDSLEPDEGFRVRAAGITDREGERIEYSEAEVCLRISGEPAYTCMPLAGADVDADAAARYVYATTPDLTAKGIDVRVRTRLEGGVYSDVAWKKDVKVGDDATRSLLCTGLVVKELSGTLGSVRLYLDPDPDPDAGAVARCPVDAGSSAAAQ